MRDILVIIDGGFLVTWWSIMLRRKYPEGVSTIFDQNFNSEHEDAIWLRDKYLSLVPVLDYNTSYHTVVVGDKGPYKRKEYYAGYKGDRGRCEIKDRCKQILEQGVMSSEFRYFYVEGAEADDLAYCLTDIWRKRSKVICVADDSDWGWGFPNTQQYKIRRPSFIEPAAKQQIRLRKFSESIKGSHNNLPRLVEWDKMRVRYNSYKELYKHWQRAGDKVLYELGVPQDRLQINRHLLDDKYWADKFRADCNNFLTNILTN